MWYVSFLIIDGVCCETLAAITGVNEHVSVHLLEARRYWMKESLKYVAGRFFTRSSAYTI